MEGEILKDINILEEWLKEEIKVAPLLNIKQLERVLIKIREIKDNSKILKCPVCKSEKVKERLIKPVMYGGVNAVDYYWCLECCVMFKKVATNDET